MTDDKHDKIESVENERSRRHVLWILTAFCLTWLVSTSYAAVSTASDITNKATSSLTGQRILYIVTTLSEYDNGHRDTVRGFDRLQETLIPVVRESIESMTVAGFDVDLVIISHYNMTRRYLVRQAIPGAVGLEVWDDASPLGYKLEDTKHNYTQTITRALARQHRYIIKDKLSYYDFYVNFEDDMLITGDAILNFMEVSEDLQKLRSSAPETLSSSQQHDFFGVLSKIQLKRMIPGFMRVEVLLDEEQYGAREEQGPVPISDRPQMDPKPCCQLHNPLTKNRNRPANPESNKLIMWESDVKAMGMRKMPASSILDWVLLQRGPRPAVLDHVIGDYWSGTDGYFNTAEDPEERRRPDTKAFRYINNQGGWMATRQQIWEWHTELCPGGFLPPYEDPEYHLDGLDKRNVEYWSGGLSIYTKEHGCNLQRIISLDHDRFARSLLYHTANNKQKQFKNRRHFLVKINDFMGELNTVQTNAEVALLKRSEAVTDALHGT